MGSGDGEDEREDWWWLHGGGRLWLTVTSWHRPGLVCVCVCVCSLRGQFALPKGHSSANRRTCIGEGRPAVFGGRFTLSHVGHRGLAARVIEGCPAPADDGRHRHKRPHGAVKVRQALTTDGPQAGPSVLAVVGEFYRRREGEKMRLSSPFFFIIFTVLIFLRLSSSVVLYFIFCFFVSRCSPLPMLPVRTAMSS